MAGPWVVGFLWQEEGDMPGADLATGTLSSTSFCTIYHAFTTSLFLAFRLSDIRFYRLAHCFQEIGEMDGIPRMRKKL